MYLTTCTRPDLAFSVGQLSRYVQNPTQHIGAAKRVLRYLVDTKTQGIVYTRIKSAEQKPELIVDGYCDSDWGNDPDTRKSNTEAEYVATCEVCIEGQGLRNMLIQVFPDLETKVRMGIDNQPAYVVATNPTYSRRTRHIELRWHYVRAQVAKKTARIIECDDRFV
ncbi:Copia type Polyprotein [Phytophthora megakarya]|uniref:Copia type Polyprotein n=1 Tax=Phytophthora megakarya TaxID=4795 RepID=A0A225UTY2_9STRA|nr:Copia type Polyprotein [Phytophthora megakarya]